MNFHIHFSTILTLQKFATFALCIEKTISLFLFIPSLVYPSNCRCASLWPPFLVSQNLLPISIPLERFHNNLMAVLVFKKAEYHNGSHIWRMYGMMEADRRRCLRKRNIRNSHSRLTPFFGLVQLGQREDREQLPSTSIQTTLASAYPDVHSHPRNDQKTEEY